MKKLIVALFLCLSFACQTKLKQGQVVGISGKHVNSTPLGIKVHSETGASAEELAQVDKGFSEAKADAITSKYLRKLDPTEYQVDIANQCVPSPQQGIPSFKVNASGSPYDGSIYDLDNSKGELPKEQQDGFKKYVPDGTAEIWAAEQLIDSGLGYPYQSNTAEIEVCRELLENGTRYGAEHVMIGHNDPVYYNLTQYHDKYAHLLLPQLTPRHPYLIVNGVHIPDPLQLDPSATPYPTPIATSSIDPNNLPQTGGF